MYDPQAMPLHGARSQSIEREQLAPFRVDSEYTPAGDQPAAIAAITARLKQGERDTALLGVTGSGKTFTVAHTIQNLQRPALVLAHNKTLAAQLYSEMKSFFPDNAVEYFVSYYDYYQPEAYIAKTDTFIEKDSAINERIDLMRHSATRSLLERRDVIVVASVSCIYGIGSPDLYYQMTVKLDKGNDYPIADLKKKLVELSYQRNDIDFKRGSFRAQGDTMDIFPSHYEDRAWRLSFFGDEIDDICEFDPLTGERTAKLDSITIYASSHYVTPRPTLLQAATQIKEDLNIRLEELYAANKLVEAQRLQQRTTFDLEMMRETGTCKGIENYSRYLSGRNAGEPPPTLFEYLPEDALLFVDESHVTVPQIGGMYNGDRARKNNLVEHGFRLPSARDNRPMQFEEWDAMRPQTVFVSATPGKFEIERTEGEVIQQLIRPTGLPDPICIIRPVAIQVDDLIAEAKDMCARNMRTLVTTLTKRMAEDLTEYLKENGLSVAYMHSDVKTLDRIEAIQKLRAGEYDILVGVNLLREGLDIPEAGLMAIFDADKEGFLRSETALVQTIGRAARNLEGRVILYADKMTNSLTRALDETARRREIQIAHNEKHGIIPRGIVKSAMQGFEHVMGDEADEASLSDTAKKTLSFSNMTEKQRKAYIEKLRKDMTAAASDLDFEKAMRLRDEIAALEKALML